MLTMKTRMLIQAGITGLGTAAGLVAFAKLSKKMKKPYVPALVGGGVAAAVSLLWQLADIYLIEKELGAATDVVDDFINSGKWEDMLSKLGGAGGAAAAAAAGGGSGTVSGLGMTHVDRKRLGLFNVQKVGLIDAQRTGLYVSDPSVKKYNTAPSTRYFS